MSVPTDHLRFQHKLIGSDGAMEFLKTLAWILLNVGVPLLGPIALLPLLGASKKHRGNVGRLIRRSLQEGQLFWTVIAMCAAACYELAGHFSSEGTRAEAQTRAAIIWFGISWHVLIIVGASVLVLLGTIDAVNEEDQPAGEQTPTAGNASRIMILSIWMAIISAASFCAVHVWAS
jgi:hypothetical protein